MPSRGFVALPGVDPARVRLEHVHAAVSRWFDRCPAEHAATDKPYRISPLGRGPGRIAVGVEVAALTDAAEERLRAAAVPGEEIRLGNQIRRIADMHPLAAASWQELAAERGDARWDLEFVTPTTFRTGDRSSPLPRVESVLEGLHRAWRLWSDVDLGCGERDWAAVWASDVDLRSATLELRVRRRDGSAQPVTMSGAVGTLVLRCDVPEVASRIGPLLRLASYAGVGGMTLKGMGVTRVRCHRRRSAHRSAEDDGHGAAS